MKNWHYLVTGFAAFYIAVIVRSGLKNYAGVAI